MKPIITPEEMADRLDRDADTMDIGRPPVQCTRRQAANMIRQMALKMAKGNVWQEAVDRQLVSTFLGVANSNSTQEHADKALAELIDWHMKVAVDPAVNGGYVLMKTGEHVSPYHAEMRPLVDWLNWFLSNVPDSSDYRWLKMKEAAQLLEQQDLLIQYYKGLTKTVWIPLDAATINQFAMGEMNGDWWLATKCYDSPIVGRYEWIQGRKPNGFNCGHTARLGVDEITHVAKYNQPEMPK